MRLLKIDPAPVPVGDGMAFSPNVVLLFIEDDEKRVFVTQMELKEVSETSVERVMADLAERLQTLKKVQQSKIAKLVTPAGVIPFPGGNIS